MNTREIEHMWKIASDDPHHDTNWFDPKVIMFAQLVAAAERDKWMERAAILIRGEREACAKAIEDEAWRLKAHALDLDSKSVNSRAIQTFLCAELLRKSNHV